MAAVSGLDYDERVRCRALVVQAAELGLAHAGQVHYRQRSGKRWDGIARHRDAALGQFPENADCSSYVTWCLWNGLFLRYGLPDTVNGQEWRAGYTGTLRVHGKGVDENDILPGDCVFYDPPHVTIVVSTLHGVPMVVSHGSEGGPYHVKYNYRPPAKITRYI
jgi:hypothetical protein